MLVLAGPQGLSAPRLSSPTGRTVIIEWDPPAVPNGVILKYQIQRRLMSGGNPSVISEVNSSLARRHVDNTVQPLTAYQYRLIAFNSGPGDPSPYSNITTGQGGKCACACRHAKVYLLQTLSSCSNSYVAMTFDFHFC